MMIDLRMNKGTPLVQGWYRTGNLNGKIIYRYWLGDVWSQGITTDTSIEDVLKYGLKRSVMSATVVWHSIDKLPEFLRALSDEVILKLTSVDVNNP